MRKLTLQIILSLFVLSIFASLPAQAQKMPKWFKIGVQAYTYRNHIGQNPDKILDLVRDLGIQEMEGGGSKTLSNADFLKKSISCLCKFLNRGIYPEVGLRPSVFTSRLPSYSALIPDL